MPLMMPGAREAALTGDMGGKPLSQPWVNFLQRISETVHEPGDMMLTAAATKGDGWLPADGTDLLRDKYPELFARIGIIYGAGDGTSTFNLPLRTDGPGTWFIRVAP